MNLLNRKLHSTPGVYKITSIINNKIYIGSSKDLYFRILSHRGELKNNNHFNIYLQRAYNKYGKNNFKAEILEYCSEELLREREQYYINILNPDFNIVKDVSMQTMTDEIKAKISIGVRKAKAEGKMIPFITYKAVDQYDLDGNLIKHHRSVKEAAISLGITSVNTIPISCNSTTHLSCGYKWQWPGEKFNYRHFLLVIDILDNVVYKFHNFKDAEEEFGFPRSAIINRLKRYGDGIVYKDRYAFHDRRYNRKLLVTKHKWKKEIKYNKLPPELL